MVMRIRPAYAIGLLAVITLVGAFVVLNRHESSADSQTTDDAYVKADFTVIVPEVAGVITHVLVEDNQPVRAGEPLVRIDQRRLRIELDAANAGIARAQANMDSLNSQISRQQSVIAQAQAAVNASNATLKLAKADLQRFTNLARDGSGTVQAQQQAEAQTDVAQAALARDLAGLNSAKQQTAILKAALEEAQAALASAQAEKSAAELNLSHADLVAPVSGVVTQRRARVGGYVHVGDPLLTLVPLDAIYIEASFRETQLARIQVGQPVSIAVDALPGIALKGQVASLGPASGVSLSAIPSHNATGNFTKIVQRLPVRIQLQEGQQDAQRLRVGMSVRPSVNVSTVSSAESQPQALAGAQAGIGG
ncbi:HlyD family secretion protein [Pseudomonas sp. MYb185]|uniref:HlyD family secretion protein n=1 Tax=Pseudomonas sp. MYb185 TaxID=1848729 RepID=UPI000CFE0AC1|nr:HlyD family secretion protein [Pseudomonas sp. MYb185]PRB82858.1 efflux transporter periplasmic adaptor subunit [Pseudomonas sp. MYb185]